MDEIVLMLFGLIMAVAILAAFWSLVSIYTATLNAKADSALLIYKVKGGEEMKVLWIDKEKGVSGVVITPTVTKVYRVVGEVGVAAPTR